MSTDIKAIARQDIIRVRVDIENISAVAAQSFSEQSALRNELLQQSKLHQR